LDNHVVAARPRDSPTVLRNVLRFRRELRHGAPMRHALRENLATILRGDSFALAVR